MSTSNVDGNLARRVETLRRERGGEVDLDDVAGVVESLIAGIKGDITGMQVRLQRELEDLVAYIQRAKTEIADLSPSDIPDRHIPDATDELDAVVSATEEATGAILDAAEELEKLAGDLSGEAAEKIMDITTKIYEASNFQDITGQRITKVVSTLKHIEAKVRTLAKACGYELAGEIADGDGAPAGDGALISGPQLPGKGNSQEDIDALLESFD